MRGNWLQSCLGYFSFDHNVLSIIPARHYSGYHSKLGSFGVTAVILRFLTLNMYKNDGLLLWLLGWLNLCSALAWPLIAFPGCFGQGILTNETRCLRCETVTARDETFLDLSLDIEQNSSITSCLKNFSSTETLNAEDKFFCDKCCRQAIFSVLCWCLFGEHNLTSCLPYLPPSQCS